MDKWFTGLRAPLQPTWNGLIRLQLGLQGKDPSLMSPLEQTGIVRAYQQHTFGRSIGNQRLMDLLPLPARPERHWFYDMHSKLPWLESRNAYVMHQSAARTRRICDEVERFKPRFVIFYGFECERIWKDIAMTDLAGVGIDKLRVGHRDMTTYAIVRHPVARGVTRDYFFRVGNILAAQSLEKIRSEI